MNKKELWLKSARLQFSPGKKKACEYCHKYKEITHAHHRIPLIKQYENHGGIFAAEHDIIWLCPNHHALVHALEYGKSKDIQSFGHRSSEALLDMEKSGEDIMVFLKWFFKEIKGEQQNDK